MRRPSRGSRAAIGFALLFTPTLCFAAALLKYELHVGILYDALARVLSSRSVGSASPALLVGALAAALALNVYAVADLSAGASHAVHPGPARRAATWLVIAASALLLAVLVAYM